VDDHKPPRLTGDERTTLCALLQYQRDSFVRKVRGVDDRVARETIVGSGTTLLWLTKHVARAEHLWVVQRFAGQRVDGPDDEVHHADTLAKAIEAYRRKWMDVDEIVAASSLDALCQDVGDDTPVNLRWVLMHLLEETARHAGHADILREVIDGQTGR